jgi:hypothetical protein
MGDIYRIGGLADAKIIDSEGNETDIPYINAFGLEPEYETLEYEGDGETVQDYYNLRLSGTLGFDKFSEDVLTELFGITAVTSGAGIDGVESKRYYMGQAAELRPVQVGLQIDFAAFNDATDVAATVRITVFKARMQPYTPPEGENAAKFAPHTYSWNAEKTTTDIESAALPGVPTGGAFYAVSILA